MADIAIHVRARQSEAAAAAAPPDRVVNRDRGVDHHMAQQIGGLNLLADALDDNREQPVRPTVARRLFDHPAAEMQPQMQQRDEYAPMQHAPLQSSSARPQPPLQSNPQQQPAWQHAQPPYGSFPPSGGPMGGPPMPSQQAYGPSPCVGPPAYLMVPYPFGHQAPPPVYYQAAPSGAAAYQQHMHAPAQYQGAPPSGAQGYFDPSSDPSRQ